MTTKTDATSDEREQSLEDALASEATAHIQTAGVLQTEIDRIQEKFRAYEKYKGEEIWILRDHIRKLELNLREATDLISKERQAAKVLEDALVKVMVEPVNGYVVSIIKEALKLAKQIREGLK